MQKEQILKGFSRYHCQLHPSVNLINRIAQCIQFTHTHTHTLTLWCMSRNMCVYIVYLVVCVWVDVQLFTSTTKMFPDPYNFGHPAFSSLVPITQCVHETLLSHYLPLRQHTVLATMESIEVQNTYRIHACVSLSTYIVHIHKVSVNTCIYMD